MGDISYGTGVPGRRRALRRALTGGGIAGITTLSVWTTPVIRSITLPAHAATSNPGARGSSRYSLVVDEADGSVSRGSHSSTLLAQTMQAAFNHVVPVARAQGIPHRRLALIERTGVRFDFYLLESEILADDCISQHLFLARGLTPFEPATAEWHLCDGTIVEGPSVELVDVIDSDATITLDGLERFTLQRDATANPLGIMPCPPCLEEE